MEQKNNSKFSFNQFRTNGVISQSSLQKLQSQENTRYFEAQSCEEIAENEIGRSFSLREEEMDQRMVPEPHKQSPQMSLSRQFLQDNTIAALDMDKLL